MKKLVVWYVPKKDEYYHKVVKGLYHEQYDYSVGSINSYGHIIVDVYDFPIESLSKKQLLINKCISFLKNL